MDGEGLCKSQQCMSQFRNKDLKSPRLGMMLGLAKSLSLLRQHFLNDTAWLDSGEFKIKTL